MVMQRMKLPASFNSRPHKEVDIRSAFLVLLAALFQFTTSQGGRHTTTKGDGDGIFLSIHDLTRRSTTTARFQSIQTVLSIHDLTRRSTGSVTGLYMRYLPFNSRPHKEVDPERNGEEFDKQYLSIHDLTRRST